MHWYFTVKLICNSPVNLELIKKKRKFNTLILTDYLGSLTEHNSFQNMKVDCREAMNYLLLT